MTTLGSPTPPGVPQRLRRGKTVRFALVTALAVGCGGAPRVSPAPAPAPVGSSPQPAETVDPLGPRPTPKEPVAFVPPEPRVLEGPGHSKIWLLERHNLPLASVAV